MNVAQLFDLSNIYVLPFWALMILLPGWRVTRKVMGSLVPFIPLAGLYIFLFARSLDSEAAQALANPTLAAVATFFAEETPAATGWTHFLVMDLFVGRWIYLEGQRTGIWTVHSLALCLFAGPMGVLSHIVTAWISGAVGRQSAVDASAADAG
ncbi:MAG: ABA4-like family protein [Cyanobacteria bacterium J06641_5]